MLQLTRDDVYLNQQADNKQEAIKKIASALTERGLVEQGYVDGMLERESQAATYLGSGIAIPHGTTKTRHLVKKTGVQVFHFPQGVAWGDDGEKAYIAIGIAASSDEHLTLLRQLTHVLGDDGVEDRIQKIKTTDDIVALLTGKSEATDSEELVLNDSLLLLDIPADSLQTLQALNASRLKRVDAVNTAFIAQTLDNQPTYLGQGVWLSDSVEGNLKNAIAISRPSNDIKESDKPVKLLITMSAKTDAVNTIVEKLATMAFNQQFSALHTASQEQFIQLLTGKASTSTTVDTASESTAQEQQTANGDEQSLSREFVVLNAHGLHTRPSSVLVKLVKAFNSKVTVSNLDGTGVPVSATSLMKIVAIGAKKGSRLQFIATGSDAEQALDAIAKAISEGFGEGTE